MIVNVGTLIRLRWRKQFTNPAERKDWTWNNVYIGKHQGKVAAVTRSGHLNHPMEDYFQDGRIAATARYKRAVYNRKSK